LPCMIVEMVKMLVDTRLTPESAKTYGYEGMRQIDLTV